MLKKDDIFIDWSLWSVAGPIVLSILWFECGLSSNQISTNDARNVVLLVVDPSSIHHYIFWVWPMLSPCSLNYGIPFKRKPRWIVVEPIDNILISSMILLDIKLVLETFESIIFMLAHEVFVWWKEWLPLIHVHLVKVAAENLRKLVLLPLESSQVSHAYVRSILWSGDLQPSFHMCSEHTKPLIELFKDKGVCPRWTLWTSTRGDFDVINDGSPPELGSVLL